MNKKMRTKIIEADAGNTAKLIFALDHAAKNLEACENPRGPMAKAIVATTAKRCQEYLAAIESEGK